MIRFFLVTLFLILYLIFTLPVLLLLWGIGKWNRSLRDRLSLTIVQWAFRCILKIAGVNAIYRGEEYLPKGEAVLFVSNHRSFFDVLLTYVKCPSLTGYIAKKEMKKVPLLNLWMRYVYCLFLDRTDPRAGLQTILKGIEQIQQGISMTIFPEGTRNKGEELSLLPFKAGSLKIAEKTGCPIIPVSINNSADIFENHFPKIRRTTVIIEYGKPIYTSALTKDEKNHLTSHCQAIIQETIHRNAKGVHAHGTT